MTQILALSGKKQSGKNTSFNFLLGLEMVRSALVRGNFMVDKEGRLWVSDLWGDETYQGFFDPNRRTESMIRLMNENIYPYIKPYSFADILKQDVCIGILGLSHEQCYGTDEQKDSPTHLRWENMVGVTNYYLAGDLIDHHEGTLDGETISFSELGLIRHESGPMTAREVMQYVGTDIFRKMYGDVWAESTIRRIHADGSEFAVITDCRFPNEVDVIQGAGGKVIRLTRAPHGNSDQHASETALDPDNFDWERFDYVLNNTEMNVDQQNTVLHKTLVEWEWIEKFAQTPVKELTE